MKSTGITHLEAGRQGATVNTKRRKEHWESKRGRLRAELRGKSLQAPSASAVIRKASSSIAKEPNLRGLLNSAVAS